MHATAALDPNRTGPKQRLDGMDALRGLALAGMLVVHFQYYAHDGGAWSNRINSAVDFLAVNRFYPLFSMLFGAGFAIQLERWGDRPGFVAMYLRRLLVLMLFAVALIAFTGYAVLEAYALWGLTFLLIRKWSNRALIAMVIFCALSGPLAQAGRYAWERRTLTVDQSNDIVKAEAKSRQQYLDANDRLRDEHAWRELMTLRLRHTFSPYLHWQNYVPFHPMTMMMVGVLVVRLRILHEAQHYRKLLWFLAIFAVFALAADWAIAYSQWLQSDSLRLRTARGMLSFVVFEQTQALGYAAVLLLWISGKPSIPWISRALASMGRLSLTNYVMQIVILETLFASSTPVFKVDRWGALAGVVVVLIFQVVFSRWWMARFRYGPLEWVWRSLTLQRWQPILRERATAA